MDTITHSLVGYAVARSGISKITGKTGVIVGVIASIFPDIDIIPGLFFGPEFHIRIHRSFTNSLFLWPLFSFAIAFFASRISQKRDWFRIFFLIAFLEIGVHTLLDLLTSYGTMILSPFYNKRFCLDILFVIDPWFSIIFILALIFSWRYSHISKYIVRSAIIIGGIYILFCAFNHEMALKFTQRICQERDIAYYNISAIPQPLSPFHWAVFVDQRDNILMGYLSLLKKSNSTKRNYKNHIHKEWLVKRHFAHYKDINHTKLLSFKKRDESPWIKRALLLRDVQMYLQFARFLIIKYKLDNRGYHHVKLIDLRFFIPELKPHFVYSIVFDSKGNLVYKGIDGD